MRKENGAKISWREIRRTMNAFEKAIQQTENPSPEEVRNILKVRAKELAKEDIVTEISESIEVVEFQLAGETYAIESLYVHAIHPLTNLMPLPCTPSFVCGIVNIQGQIISVINIGALFELPDGGLTNLNKFIVLDAGPMRFGILADAIIGVRLIPMEEIQPSIPTLSGIQAEYLKGVTAGRTVVLDAERLITDKKLIVQEQVG